MLHNCVRVLATLAVLSLAAPAAAEPAAAESVVDRVRKIGMVTCGIDQTPGFSGFDASGRPVGFEVDFCRAVAAAVLGDANAIQVRRVSTANKFDALRAAELDIAFGMTTWTFTRDTALGTVFPQVLLYDGQGFMAWDESGIADAAGLRGKRICVQSGTTSAANLRDFMAARGMVAEIVGQASSDEKMNAFAQRLCDVVTGDRSELSAQRARRAAAAEKWRILPDIISREPLGPAVAQGDAQWFAVVRWAILATLVAEYRGVTAAGIAGLDPGSDSELRRLTGTEPGFGAELGLEPGWARQIIAQVGNYAEIYQRNLAPLGLQRGANRLWRDGGLLYAPPLR